MHVQEEEPVQVQVEEPMQVQVEEPVQVQGKSVQDEAKPEEDCDKEEHPQRKEPEEKEAEEINEEDPLELQFTPGKEEGELAEEDDLDQPSSAALQVDACLCRIKEVFSKALQHRSPKAVQTAVSSMQNLLQNPTCMLLSPVIVPCLLISLTSPGVSFPESSLESAWCVVTAMAASQEPGTSTSFMAVTIHMMLRVVVSVLRHERGAKQMSTHKPAMAQCLVQLTRADQAAMKAEVSALPAEAQQAIQQLLREHVSVMSAGAGAQGAPKAAAAPAKKIELKLKF